MQKVLMWISIIAVVTLGVLNIVWPEKQPDEVYEFSNRNIKWYYAGK